MAKSHIYGVLTKYMEDVDGIVNRFSNEGFGSKEINWLRV